MTPSQRDQPKTSTHDESPANTDHMNNAEQTTDSTSAPGDSTASEENEAPWHVTVSLPANSWRGADWSAFFGLVGLAFVLRLALARVYPNIMWPDELFQSLEQAHRLVYGYGFLPWEFVAYTRNWILPDLLAGVMWFTKSIGLGPVGYVWGHQIVLCALATIPVGVGYAWGHRISGRLGAALAATFALLWFDLLYFAPKALTESVAAHIWLLGLYLAWTARHDQRLRLLTSGLFSGIALLMRPQLTPAILLALVLTSREHWKQRWVPQIWGMLLLVVVSGMLDYLHTGIFARTTINTFLVNIIGQISKLYGEYVWYDYLRMFKNVWSWTALPLLFFLLWGARRSKPLFWLGLLLLVIHSMIGHKEYRFLYPMIVLWITLVGLGAAESIQAWRQKQRSSAWISAWAAFLVLSWGGMSYYNACHFTNASTRKSLDDEQRQSFWHIYKGSIRAFERLRKVPQLCGLGIHRMPWSLSGGYYHLHRNVPIYLVPNAFAFPRMEDHFNYMLYRGEPYPTVGNLSKIQCWGPVCLYGRQGPCRKAPPDYNVNEVLRKRGQ